MIIELCTNVLYFQKPMDLCMNFAALAFLFEIDDLICYVNYFSIIKAKYKLFEEKEYDLYAIEHMGSINAMLIPYKYSQKIPAICNCINLSTVLIVVVLIITAETGPYGLLDRLSMYKHFYGPYW